MNIIEWYLSVGGALYSCFFLRDALEGFPRLYPADLKSVLRGLCLIVLWPALPWMLR